MSGISKKLAVWTGTAAAAISLSVFAVREIQTSGRPPNVLVFSFCSLKKGHLGLFGYAKRPTSPNIDGYFNQPGAVVFDKAFNSMGWTSLVTVTTAKFGGEFWKRTGYRLLGRQMLRIPKDHFYEEDQSVEVS